MRVDKSLGKNTEEAFFKTPIKDILENSLLRKLPQQEEEGLETIGWTFLVGIMFHFSVPKY